jgi:hypothetical protein
VALALVAWSATAEVSPPRAGAPPRARRASADPFRFLHFQEQRPGQALEEIVLRLDGSAAFREVRYLGQTHRDTAPLPVGLRDVLVTLLRQTEVWPYWTGEDRGCLAFGDGAATREALLGHRHNADPAMERFIAIVRLESLQMAYAGELERYATDEPSLAAGTISTLVGDVKAGRIGADSRTLALLRRIATDRTVRTLVRESAVTALAQLGISLDPSGPVDPQGTPPPRPPGAAADAVEMAD